MRQSTIIEGKTTVTTGSWMSVTNVFYFTVMQILNEI